MYLCNCCMLVLLSLHSLLIGYDYDKGKKTRRQRLYAHCTSILTKPFILFYRKESSQKGWKNQILLLFSTSFNSSNSKDYISDQAKLVLYLIEMKNFLEEQKEIRNINKIEIINLNILLIYME